MTVKNRKIVQVTLISIGLLLIFLTYFYYPNISKNKLFKEQFTKKDFKESTNDDQVTTFKNLQFKGLYGDKPFTVISDTAFINEENEDIVNMSGMLVILYLEENRVVRITSQKGRYNKLNYDCFFELDVVAEDGETFITADNLDMLAEKNIIEIYNNVSLNYPTGTLLADKIQYDFESKLMKITDKNVVKMKVIQ